ncbi:putative calcium-transporting ATPase 11, plasma membrane-type [Selaginella moellendorffii]|uniref:putative calcium-transporting ATPase 11, plasma membrane-type n=1 Tax=Selaginella moellendorffii TaxID=88036 RepID=UPI000D1C8D2C|nr:putative calcium-transporting ATPase 11, plasma membrane-type [Selaginella moellendorffii]|eukprot:XP_024518924.1 putative calcium-transporting ATPase 11, plasma membrane-type [Selaginella moellendorffii]
MLFDHDSAQNVRERAALKLPRPSEFIGPDDEPPPPITARTAGFGITPAEIAKWEGNTEELEAYDGFDGIARALKIDPQKGIDATPVDIKARRDAFGPNTYPLKKRTPFYMYVWEALQDETLMILILCAIVSLAVGLTTEKPSEGWYDGGGICFAIVVCVMVASLSDYNQANQFQKLSAEKRKIYINVTRGGHRTKVSIFELVVGDMVHLAIGDQIPADGLVYVGHSLIVDESSMTGESDPLPKDEEEKPFLMSGTKVLDGFGTMLVTAVGMRTEWGRVMATLSEDNDEETPLQVRLNNLATIIGKVGLSVAVVCFIVCVIRFLCQTNLKHFSSEDGRQIVEYFAVAVTIVVVAVPEGLPLAVTLTLAYSMKKMMSDRALVRHLSACETMGSATAICSDKTGTLTMNMMTVIRSWVCGKLREPTDLENISEGVRKVWQLWFDLSVFTSFWQLLFEAICLNTNASVEMHEGAPPEITGTPTEVAVLGWGIKLGGNFDRVKKSATVTEVDAFNSTKKRMAVIAKTEDGKAWIHWKGASEVVLAQCSNFMDEQGNVSPLTPEKLQELQEIIDTFANAALRTLCLACKEFPQNEFLARPPKKHSTIGPPIPEDGLTCIAIVGIKDPCRPGVPEAVHKCQIAGIKVRMVTGDNITTAKAIAVECGILTNGTAIEGKDFRNMSPDEQYEILPAIQVMARSSPTDKHTMVKRLLEMGEIVAVTGDGTNDAPALHEASIGLSMGITGTEVAKESSDIIIMDDDFASIVKVVRWGRAVYANIQKFVQFQCTVNAVALMLNFISALSEGAAPLTAVQLLWVNLIMDTLGALALATEPPNDAVMYRPPISKEAPLINNIMWRNIMGQGMYQLALLLVLKFKGIEILNLKDDPNAPPPPPRSAHAKPEGAAHEKLVCIIFNAFVFCQVFNEMNARNPEKINVFKGFTSNRLFMGVILFTAIVQALLVEYGGTIVSTIHLEWNHWILCVILGAISLPLAALVKLIPIPDRPFGEYLIFWRRKKHRKQKLLTRSGRSIKGIMFNRPPSATTGAPPAPKKFYDTAGIDAQGVPAGPPRRLSDLARRPSAERRKESLTGALSAPTVTTASTTEGGVLTKVLGSPPEPGAATEQAPLRRNSQAWAEEAPTS